MIVAGGGAGLSVKLLIVGLGLLQRCNSVQQKLPTWFNRLHLLDYLLKLVKLCMRYPLCTDTGAIQIRTELEI